MTGVSKEKMDNIISDPSAVFDNPEDVLSDSELSYDQKITVLKQWAYDAKELQVAEEENMPAGSSTPTRLRQILLALHSLENEQQ